MSKTPDKYLKPYDPKSTEASIYTSWEESGLFNPDVCAKEGYVTDKSDEYPEGKPFTMVLPPPNVTGTLHIGHASMLVIEDIMIRFERMRGKRTLWIPGTDHAAIATQSKVEAQIYKDEKKRRHEIGREELLKRVEDFASKSQNTIINQVKRMGASIDWSRLAFTLDKERELAVYTAFKKMYEDGLIYRGHRIVNWDPKGQTTISDDELVYVEEKTKFYYFKYGPFIIGTARPETKFGDKYVVMHPDDPRYKNYRHGQKFETEWINGPITATVIKDESIDMNFGTGVMTITPWHSTVDFDIATRHNLDKEQIIDKYGKLLPVAGEFAGMKITDARSKIVDKLRSKGLLATSEEINAVLLKKSEDGKPIENEADYIHNIATAERTGGIVEPQIMNQWFINVNKEFSLVKPPEGGIGIDKIKPGTKVTLKTLMRTVVENGQTEIMPERFSKVYFHWINNLNDWCISRQIWYGHRIPVWYKGEEIHCDVLPPKGSDWVQDEDTLDTWFSSGLWTFSTLGWPDQKKFAENRLKYHYHPNSVLETGYDILFFWVARMILMSTYLLGEIPFSKVYLHGLVRDAKGQKMSKSIGNIIDPLDVADKYGTDAVRMSLIVGTGPGNDLKMSEDKIRGYKNFANKIWNVTRFVLTNTEDFAMSSDAPADKEFMEFVADINSEMEKMNYHLAADKLYQYFWHTFADKTIEEAKASLVPEANPDARRNTQAKLMNTLVTLLKLLHPFMPYITEEIWKDIPVGVPGKSKSNMMMVEKWPKVDVVNV